MTRWVRILRFIGGLTTLGVNTFNMAMPAILCYYLFGQGISHKNPSVAAAWIQALCWLDTSSATPRKAYTKLRPRAARLKRGDGFSTPLLPTQARP